MELRYNLWLEKNGQVALSLWRMKLLKAVKNSGSISEGARRMDVPYRIAWQKINEMEEQLGEKLVRTTVGGRNGGGAELTDLAEKLVQQFAHLADDSQAFIEARYAELFPDD